MKRARDAAANEPVASRALPHSSWPLSLPSVFVACVLTVIGRFGEPATILAFNGAAAILLISTLAFLALPANRRQQVRKVIHPGQAWGVAYSATALLLVSMYGVILVELNMWELIPVIVIAPTAAVIATFTVKQRRMALAMLCQFVSMGVLAIYYTHPRSRFYDYLPASVIDVLENVLLASQPWFELFSPLITCCIVRLVAKRIPAFAPSSQ